jgi:hypothetical protein
MARWEKTERRLKPNHAWRCSKGHRLCVMGRGDLWVEYPESWIATPSDNSLLFQDKPSGKDNYRLEVSVMHFPEIMGDAPPLAYFLQEATLKNGHYVASEEIVNDDRLDMRLVWISYEKPDSIQPDRMVTWHHAFGQCRIVFALLTFCYWSDLATKGRSHWQHILTTLQLNRPIDDPEHGPILH